MGGVMGEKIEAPKWVEPAIHHPDEDNLSTRSSKRSKPVSGQVAVNERTTLVESCENSRFYNRFQKKRSGLSRVIEMIYRLFKLILGSKEYQGGFFHAEEQRKFMLDHQLRKQWPLEPMHHSFMQRKDL